MERNNKNIWQILGPGILYAAAAVGISHIVQATRAGADYGLGLTLVIVVACALKYPSLRFGGDYAVATGTSLISSYRAEGWWAYGIYCLAQLYSVVFVVAALGISTLGMMKAAMGFEISNLLGAAILYVAVAVLVLTGRYHVVESVTKYIVAILTVLILLATIIVIPRIDWSLSAFAMPAITAGMIMYLVAIVGFMPTPPDGSVLQSLWTVARAESEGEMAKPSESRLDFNVGYIGSVFLALCFMLLGAGVMHNSGQEFASTNGGFAAQFMQLFTETVGDWAFPVIATASVFVMLSTLISVADGMTRVVVTAADEMRQEKMTADARARSFNVALLIIFLLALVVIATMMRSFTTFIDLVTVLAFLISPVLAFLNHRAMMSERVPAERKPRPFLRVWSLVAAWCLLAMTLLYIYLRLF